MNVTTQFTFSQWVRPEEIDRFRKAVAEVDEYRKEQWQEMETKKADSGGYYALPEGAYSPTPGTFEPSLTIISETPTEGVHNSYVEVEMLLHPKATLGVLFDLGDRYGFSRGYDVASPEGKRGGTKK